MLQVKAYSFSEIGNKDNQEDSVFPDPHQVKPDQRYFILCDGMGGHDNGEVASKTVSSALGQYFDAHPVEVADEAYFNEALAYAYSRLDLVDTGAEKKMGTTLTCLLLNPDGFLAAHIGDSRIYQFREGEIIFKTTDHSLVNDLLKAGEITEEEAKNYPRKNIITRAMQPNGRRAKADIFISGDIRPGDFFFLCCDGVLERMYEDKFLQIFGEHTSVAEKLSAIKAECDKGTKDNYTCWLISIGGEDKGSRMNGDSLRSARARGRRILFLLLLAAFVLGGCLIFKKASSHKEQRNGRQEKQTESIEKMSDRINSLENEKAALKFERDSISNLVDSLSHIIEEVKKSLTY